MSNLFDFALLVAIVLLMRRQNKLERELFILKNEGLELRQALVRAQASRPNPKSQPPKEESSSNLSSSFTKLQTEAIGAPPFQELDSNTASPKQTAPTPLLMPQKKFQFPSLFSNHEAKWSKLTEAIKQNWAGLLGAIILVIGISFFAYMASESMGPLGRFISIMIGSSVFAALGQFLKSRKDWQDFSAWLFGISGSALLIACLGAGGLSPLRFIEHGSLALAVLLLGVLANLLMAVHVRNQYSTAFHGLIGLCALAFIPDHNLALLAGASQILMAMSLSYRRFWDKNLLLCVLGYVFFHHFVLNRSIQDGAFIPKNIGLFVTILIGVGAAAIHYDKVYKNQQNYLWALIAHLVNWCGMASLLIRYSQGLDWTGLILMAASVFLLLVARIAKKNSVMWLYRADSILGLVLCLSGIFLLQRLQWNFDILFALGIVATGCFCNLCLYEKEDLLAKVALLLQALTFLTLLVWNIEQGRDSLVSHGILLAVTLMAGVQYWDIHRHSKEPLILIQTIHWDLPFLWMNLIGLIFFQAMTSHLLSGSLLTSLVWLLVFMIGGKFQSGRSAVVMGAFTLSHVFLGSPVAGDQAPEIKALGKLMPFLVLDVYLSLNHAIRTQWTALARASVYLASATLAFFCHTATYSYSHFAPSVLYLVLSLCFFELGRYASKRSPGTPWYEWVLHSGAAYFVLFLGHHVLINITSEASLGTFSIRGLIGALGLTTLSYWLLFTPALHMNRVFPKWMSLLWEGLLVLLLLQISLELPQTYRPLALALLGLGLTAAVLRFNWPFRLAAYGWLILIVSGLQLSFILSTWPDLTQKWWQSISILGFATLAVHLLQVILVYRSRLWLTSNERTTLLWMPKQVLVFVNRWHNWLNFYPLIAFAALFFYWHFNRAVLTLLWFVEIFVVFVVALVIRDRHFVKLAYVCLGICAARLLFYDLAQSDLSVRAVVFVVCGALMLGIQAIHRKFQARLDQGEGH